jgi:hypothetical protein
MTGVRSYSRPEHSVREHGRFSVDVKTHLEDQNLSIVAGAWTIAMPFHILSLRIALLDKTDSELMFCLECDWLSTRSDTAL